MTTANLPAAPKSRLSAQLRMTKLEKAYKAAVDARNGVDMPSGATAECFALRDAAQAKADAIVDEMYAWKAFAQSHGFHVSNATTRYHGWRDAVGQND